MVLNAAWEMSADGGDFLTLKQQFDPAFIRKFKNHQAIGKFLHGSTFGRVYSRFASTILSINDDIRRRKAFLEFEDVRKLGDVSKHGYTDRYGDLRAALNYASGIADPNFSKNSHGAAYVLYQEQIKSLRKFLNEHPVKQVFNFGICFAHVDSVLAKEFPAVKFTGIDLSKYNKAFNDCEFSDIDNLEVLTGDVFKVFDSQSFEQSVLFHSRTLVLLPSEFIAKLYGAALKAGFKWIYGFEPHGLNQETTTPYIFDSSERPSVYWRDKMYIHNYLGLAHRQGFEIVSADNFTTGHSSPDLRYLRFLAERK